MPGERKARIRAAYLKNLNNMVLDPSSHYEPDLADKRIRIFDAQNENNNVMLMYFNSLSDEDFERQIKQLEKCSENAYDAIHAYVNGQNPVLRAPNAAVVVKGLFAPSTKDSGIRTSFDQSDYDKVFSDIQEEIDSKPLILPEGVDEEMATMASMGFTLKDDNISYLFDEMRNAPGSSINDMDNKADGVREAFFTNMTIADESRANVHFIRYAVPKARTQCQEAIDEYEKGNKQPLADAIKEAFVQNYNRIATSSLKNTPLYYFCFDNMKRCMDVLEKNDLKGLVEFSPQQLKMYSHMEKEVDSFREIRELQTKLYGRIMPKLFNNGAKKPLDDPENEKDYLRFAALKYINNMAQSEITNNEAAKKAGGDTLDSSYDRTLTMYESLAESQKEPFINAIIEKVIKPSEHFRKMKDYGSIDFAQTFRSENPYAKDYPDYAKEYKYSIVLLEKIKKDFSNNAAFTGLISDIDNVLTLDKELSQNGDPSIEALINNVPKPFKKIHEDLQAIIMPYLAKAANRTITKAENDLLTKLGNYDAKVSSMTEERFRATMEHNEFKFELLDEFLNQGGNIAALEEDDPLLARKFLEHKDKQIEDLFLSGGSDLLKDKKVEAVSQKSEEVLSQAFYRILKAADTYISEEDEHDSEKLMSLVHSEKIVKAGGVPFPKNTTFPEFFAYLREKGNLLGGNYSKEHNSLLLNTDSGYLGLKVSFSAKEISKLVQVNKKATPLNSVALTRNFHTSIKDLLADLKATDSIFSQDSTQYKEFKEALTTFTEKLADMPALSVKELQKVFSTKLTVSSSDTPRSIMEYADAYTAAKRAKTGDLSSRQIDRMSICERLRSISDRLEALGPELNPENGTSFTRGILMDTLCHKSLVQHAKNISKKQASRIFKSSKKYDKYIGDIKVTDPVKNAGSFDNALLYKVSVMKPSEVVDELISQYNEFMREAVNQNHYVPEKKPDAVKKPANAQPKNAANAQPKEVKKEEPIKPLTPDDNSIYDFLRQRCRLLNEQLGALGENSTEAPSKEYTDLVNGLSKLKNSVDDLQYEYHSVGTMYKTLEAASKTADAYIAKAAESEVLDQNDMDKLEIASEICVLKSFLDPKNGPTYNDYLRTIYCYNQAKNDIKDAGDPKAYAKFLTDKPTKKQALECLLNDEAFNIRLNVLSNAKLKADAMGEGVKQPEIREQQPGMW